MRAKAVREAIDVLRNARAPEPQIGDDIGAWLPARTVAALRAHGIDTLAALTVRIRRRRHWVQSELAYGRLRAAEKRALLEVERERAAGTRSRNSTH